MLKPTERTRDLGPFRKDMKCCDYQPFLPNFRIGQILVGALNSSLQDPRSTRKLVFEFLRDAHLTAWGAWPKGNSTKPRVQRKLSVCEAGQSLKPCAFIGQAKDGTGAQCGIWDARPAVCRTYFCVEGEDIGSFAQQDQRTDQALVEEWTAATECSLAHGFTFDDLDYQFKDLTEAVEFYQKTWQTMHDLKPDPRSPR